MPGLRAACPHRCTHGDELAFGGARRPGLRSDQRRDERRVVELATVGQDVRIRVRGEAELPLAHQPADLGPRASLPMKQRDPAVPEAVR